MNKESKIKLRKHMDVTDLSGEKIMVDFQSGKYLLIKGTGNDIWDVLRDDIIVQEIMDHLMEIYEVTEDICLKEVISFLSKLEAEGIVEIVE